MVEAKATAPTCSKLLERVLLICSLVSAFLPTLVFKLMVSSRGEPIGGVAFNPVSLAAYLWLTTTIGYYRTTRRKKSLLLLMLFPIAFGLPFVVFLFRLWGGSGAP